MRALDLFCGAGGAGMGLYRAGYQVVGVDIADQPRYPFPFIKANAMEIDFSNFDLVWASPPCQAYTNAQKIRKNKHPDFVAGIRSRLKKSAKRWVIENVPGSPLENPLRLCGCMFHLGTYRERLFEANFEIKPLEHRPHVAKVAKMGRRPAPGEFMHVVGNFSGVAQARKAMNIEWMSRDELREAIPPAYSEYIATFARGLHPSGGDE